MTASAGFKSIALTTMRRLLLTTLRAAPPQLTASVRSARLFSTPAGPSASLIRELRERTGAPMVECKSALVAESGDIEKALDWLRKKGVAVAGKKAGRTTAQGLVAATVNSTGDVGALVEVRRYFSWNRTRCGSSCACA